MTMKRWVLSQGKLPEETVDGMLNQYIGVLFLQRGQPGVFCAIVSNGNGSKVDYVALDVLDVVCRNTMKPAYE